ncbi:MAG TPA: hypothetical protein DDW42_02655 [Desulfobacteraceae bacterium]|nr:hypothetical protein [Desulfobacteraceae bacterium]
MITKESIACIIVLVLFGCNTMEDKNVPEELLGEWKTSDTRYVGCVLEFTDSKIIFKNGSSYVNTNFINDIKEFHKKDIIIYEICYKDIEGEEFQLSLFYIKTRTGGHIRFRNQEKVKWTRIGPT